MKLPLLRMSVLLAAALPAVAFAAVAAPVPEPETWTLLAVAGLAAVVVTIRNRRK